MAIRFVLGRAGSGKTEHCLAALLAELDRGIEGPALILLVPEQASFQMERALALRAGAGGYSRAQVLSFSRLAQKGLNELGLGGRVVSPQARQMVLRRIAGRMRGSLRFFKQAVGTRGFFEQLDHLVEAMLREGVPLEQYQQAMRAGLEGASLRKAAELLGLCLKYRQWLDRQGRIDPALRLEALRPRLAELPWLHGACIWVDGFAGFTGQELATLIALGKTARELTITVLLDPRAPAAALPDHQPDVLDLFRRTEQTYVRLRRVFAESGLACLDPVLLDPPLRRFAESPELARLEAGLTTPLDVRIEREPGKPCEAVRLLECPTHRDELRAAARFIRTRVAESGGRLRYRDFALIARNLEPLVPLVAEVLHEYEVPYFLDRRRPMGVHPLCRLVDALFTVAAEDFSLSSVFRLLRSGLLPFSRNKAEALENLAAAHAVHGTEAWLKPDWDFRGEGSRWKVETPGLRRARLRLLEGLRPFLALWGQEGGASGRAWATALYKTLKGLRVRRRMWGWIVARRREGDWESAETHRLAWEGLRAVLSDLHDVLGDTRLTREEAAAVVLGALRSQTLGMAPPSLDQVLVASIERSRHPPVQYAWVFAFNEGIFPAPPTPDELLSSEERQRLAQAGLEGLGTHREDAFDERLLAYIACTRPSRGLTISYARVAPDGSPLWPSPLLTEVRRALPEVREETFDPYEPPACLDELAWGYLETRARAEIEPAAARRFAGLVERLGTNPDIGPRLDWLLRGRGYANRPGPVGCYRPAGEGYVWSGHPSEVEKFLACPFQHFARYGLRLDPMRRPAPVRWDLGDMAHAILSQACRRALAEAEDVRRLSDARWKAILEEVLRAYREGLPSDLPQRRPELAFLANLLGRFVSEVLLVHAERWRRGEFVPVWFEESFGLKEEAVWPPLEIAGPEGRALLSGRVDRVDVCRAGGRTWLLVYDYKSRIGKVHRTFLTGARLQLLSYLLAVCRAWPVEENPQPAGAFLAPLYPDLRVLERRYVRSANEVERRLYLYRPEGLFAREVAGLLDSGLGERPSPVARMRLKSNGDFDRGQSRGVVPAEGLKRWLDLAERTVWQAAAGMAAGEVTPAPLVEDDRLACRWCDYQALCRFDRCYNEPRSAEAVLPRLEETAGADNGGTP